MPSWSDALLLAAGVGVGLWLISNVLSTGRIHWRMDRDLVITIIFLLLPLGPAMLFTPRLAWQKCPRNWSLGEWLWLGAIVTGLAWLEVWLDAGIHLGSLVKLICGPIALLLTPALGLAAVATAIYSLRRPAAYAWTHWLGIFWSLLAAAGCIGFVLILLPLNF